MPFSRINVVFLASMLNSFCLIGNALSLSSNSHQQRHIYDGTFCRNRNQLLGADFSHNKVPTLMFAGF